MAYECSSTNTNTNYLFLVGWNTQFLKKNMKNLYHLDPHRNRIDPNLHHLLVFFHLKVNIRTIYIYLKPAPNSPHVFQQKKRQIPHVFFWHDFFHDILVPHILWRMRTQIPQILQILRSLDRAQGEKAWRCFYVSGPLKRTATGVPGLEYIPSEIGSNA